MTPAQLSALTDAQQRMWHACQRVIDDPEMVERAALLTALADARIEKESLEHRLIDASDDLNLARAERETARIEATRLREALEYAASDFENAVDYHTKLKTGMLVPWFSPWANALTPSTIGELRRLAKQFRDALVGGSK